jgi:DNA-binding NarL/FixJ family response regulator
MRILFVDDEPLVLQALKSLLRAKRNEWEMVFVGGAADALAELERKPFDVVVSDMRMPNIDGAELLERVAQQWPSTGRLILSGYADAAAKARAAEWAHVCVEKPCELEELSEAIEAAAP